jgi:transglutaminase-like putative cysteine protease
VLSLTGTVAQIRVQVDPWTEAAPLAPEPSANLAPYVTATPFIQCHDRRMIEKAREIVAGATNRQDAARAIYEWVYTKVTKEPTVSLPSALDVLLRPEGDCNEHTYLFVGLARAARLPAKIRVGLTLHKGMFYYHAWPSVYVGRWVDVDPTLGQLGVAADHISLFEGELPEQMKLMGVLGRLKVEVLAVEE